MEGDAVAIADAKQMAEGEPHGLALALFALDQVRVRKATEDLSRIGAVHPHNGGLLGQPGEKLQRPSIVVLVSPVERDHDAVEIVDLFEFLDDMG